MQKVGLGFVLVVATLSACLGDFVIESPKITNFGTWASSMTRCPDYTYVYGYRLKIQNPQTIFGDDTALNAVELLCISPQGRRNATEMKSFHAIQSSEGHAGTWRSVQECTYPRFATGFQLRSERNQLLADDTAGNDLKLACENPDDLEHPNWLPGIGATTWGEWTEERHCPRGTWLCGLRTQVEAGGQDDDTTLNNVNMQCCSKP